MISLTKKVLLSALIVFLVIISLCLFSGIILSTHSGSEFVLSLFKRYSNSTLFYKKFSGSFLGSFSFKEINFSENGTEITSTNFSMSWSPAQLLRRQLKVNRFFAEDVKVTIKPSLDEKPQKKPEKFHFPKLPVNLKISNVLLKSVKVQYGDQQPIYLTSMNLSSIVEPRKIALHLSAKLSQAIIEIDGGYSNSWDLHWRIHVPNLSGLIQDAQGSLVTKGNITGRMADPLIHAEIMGQGIKINDNHINYIKSSADVYWGSTKHSSFSLRLQGINVGNTAINQLNMHVSGNRIQQKASIGVLSPRASLQLDLTGINRGQLWAGKISSINVKLNQFGEWKLQSPAKLELSGSHFLLEKSCLHSSGNQFCFMSNWDGVRKDKLVISWGLKNLKFISALAPQLSKISGAAKGNIEVTNFINKPKVNGSFSLSNGFARVLSQGITLKSIQLEGRIVNNKMKFESSFQSGKGEIKLAGDSSISSAEKTFDLCLKGKDFLAVNSKEYKAFISPDITVKLRGSRIDLNGSVVVPQAVIAPLSFSSSATMPNDVTYATKKKEAEIPFKVYSHMSLTLGDDVTIKVKGLTGKLQGNLSVTQKPKQATIAKGLLMLKNGKYQAYGADLDVDKGEIIYRDVPVENPNLNIVTSRTITMKRTSTVTYDSDNIKVGIKVTGRAQNPRIQFYSDPTGLSQGDILSYLLTGKPVSEISSSKSTAVVALASALASGEGPGKVDQITGSLKNTFGLEELGLESNGDSSGDEPFADTSLVIGKYITPKLYVSYGIGILDPVSTVKARYYLTKRLILQTESNGLGSGADLLYSIDH